MEKDEPQFSEIAILARNRYLLEPVQVALKAQSIPYHFHATNEGLFATSPARIFYLILLVLHNPFDLIHREILLTDLGLSPQNFDTTFDELNGNTASAFLGMIAEKQETPSCWRDFIKTLLAEVNNAAMISEYYTNLLVAFEQQVFPCETDSKHDELLQRDLQLLKDKFQAFSHKHSREELDLGSFLGELALSGKSEFEGNAVHVLTLHAAKGLEFEAVFIVGMNQGSFPDYRSLRISSGLDEERRNAYVAVTRAKRMLYLTRCRQRQMPWGANQVQTPSKFLNEMGLI
jgi:DNA helicase-2/ATP-dependent DNA helicase PcrA